MRPTVLLFDVDGTLLSTDGAGRRALAAAFEAVVGRRAVVEGLDFAGRTDPSIVRHGLRMLGLVDERALVDDVLGAYVPRLRDELAAPGAVTVHAGVRAVLDTALACADVAVGLGTGNVEPGAWAKVGAGDLADAFAFGGFGSDDEDRTALLRIGAGRGAARLGAAPAACRLVVIGDTPRDLAASRTIGAECVLIGTGRFATEELRTAGGDVVFETMEADGVADAILHGPAVTR